MTLLRRLHGIVTRYKKLDVRVSELERIRTSAELERLSAWMKRQKGAEMSTHIAIDVQEGDAPIVLVVDWCKAPMTADQARTLASALTRIADDVAGEDDHRSEDLVRDIIQRAESIKVWLGPDGSRTHETHPVDTETAIAKALKDAGEIVDTASNLWRVLSGEMPA